MGDEDRTSGVRGRAFVSYSRRDSHAVAQLVTVLKTRDVEVYRDTDDILPAEEWKGRLEQLIGSSDAIIFALSSNSVSSEVCAWEVQYAQGMGKRLVPVVVGPVDSNSVPPGLARLNYIFADSPEVLERAAGEIADALERDIAWVREHTRLQELALRWESHDRSVELLLYGEELTRVLAWMRSQPAGAPPPTPLQAEFIAAGQQQTAAIDEYEQERYTALEAYVGPILRERIDSLTYEAEQAELSRQRSRLMKVSAEKGRVEAEIATVENFLAKDGRWHPASAEYVKGGGAVEDYSDIYRFPCCGRHVVTDNVKPSRFRADGCEARPGRVKSPPEQ